MLAHGLAVERHARERGAGVEIGDRAQPRAAPAGAPTSDADVAAARLVDGDAQPDLPRPDPARRATPTTCSTHLRAARRPRRTSRTATSRRSRRRSTSSASTTTGPRIDRGADRAGARRSTVWPGDERIEPLPQEGEHTTMGWVVDPERPRASCCSGSAPTTAALPLLVTENGAAFDDQVEPRRQRRRRRPGRLPRRPPPRGPPRARGRRRPARLLRLVAARQLRVGATATRSASAIVHVDYETLRADPEGERPLVLARDLGGWARRRRSADGDVGAGRAGSRPTLEEVGDVAGVSRATVSRVINNSPRVSAEVRAAVERAIAKLGYVAEPGGAARS